MIKKIIYSGLTSLFCPFAEGAVNFEQFFITSAEQHKYQKSGAYIFFKRDFDKNEKEMCELKKLYPTTLMMTDQENDIVYRIKHFKLPSHRENFKDKNIQNKADFTSLQLKNLCLDVNLAPMVEISFDNKRSSKDIEKSIEYSKFITTTLNKHNIAATWKHFPGGGFNRKPAIHTQYHYLYVKSAFSEGTVIYDDKVSLIPHINSFIHHGHNMLMISNSTYPAYSEKPAIFTPEILKKAKMVQPNSLVISDDLEQVNVEKTDILNSFKHVHMFMTTDYKQRDKVLGFLVELFKEGKITPEDVHHKKREIDFWKKTNRMLIANPT